MRDYTFILTRGTYVLDNEFVQANPQHKQEPLFLMRVKTPYAWKTAVRKAKEACLAYEKAEIEAGRLKFTEYAMRHITYFHYRHFTGGKGHASLIRIEV